MKTKTVIITAVAAAIGIGAIGIGTSFARGPFGYDGYGRGHGYGMMMQQGPGFGPGMMMQKSRGFGPGNCAYGQTQALATPLTVDDVRENMEQHLKWRGNDRLKVGTVSEKDDNTISAEIVTVDDSLVRKIEVDKTTGRFTPVK